MRPFACGALAGALGVLRLAPPAQTVLAAVPYLAALLLAALLLAALARRLRRGTTASLLVLGVLAGALSTLVECRSAASRVLDAGRVGVDLTVVGRVVGVPRRHDRRVAFDLRVDASATALALPGEAAPGDTGPAESAPGTAPARFAPRRLRLSARGIDPRAGERWRLTVRLRPLRTLRNPGGFDRVRHLLVQRIDASGYVRDAPAPRRLAGSGELGGLGGLDALRERLAARIMALDPERARAAALAQALALGVSGAVPEATRATLRDSGTAHLLAISGLHVTLVAGWGWWTGRALARRAGANAARAARIALLASLALAAGYALLAGFGLPTRRALAMLAVGLAAAATRRRVGALDGLAAALVAVLALEPLAPLSAGFWLSFGTVGAILWLGAGRGGAGADRGRRGRLAAALRVHLLLGVALLPVTAWFFGSGAWVAPLANAVAVPVVAFAIVPLAFATLALATIWPAAGAVALGLLDRISAGLLGALAWLLERTGGAWTLSLPSAEALLWCLLGLALLLGPRALAPRHLAVLLLLPALLANLRPARVEGFEVHVLDVGQGLAALVLTERETWLYDTGGWLAPGRSMLEAAVVPYLHTLGRRRVDTVVVSHPDSDHSAGLADARARWPQARVLLGRRDAASPADAEDCRAGWSELQSGVRFSFLHPAAHDGGEDNDISCVLLVHLGVSRVLLSGDIERGAERRLVDRLGGGAGLPVALLTAPHHGSRSSSSAAFVAAFRPASVVFPAGNANAFGFPHDEVIMRYKSAGAATYVTGHDGALRFAFGPDGPLGPPLSWHGSRRRFWHDMVEPS